MNKIGRRMLSFLLCLCMVLSMVPVSAYAQDIVPEETSGEVVEATAVSVEESFAVETAAAETTEAAEEETAVPEETAEEVTVPQTEETVASTEATEAALEKTVAAVEGKSESQELQAARAALEAAIAAYCTDAEDENWVLIEAMLAEMSVEDMIACMDMAGGALSAVDALCEEDQAVLQAEYSAEMEFLTELVMAINEKASTPEAVASTDNWFDTSVTGGYYNIISEKHYGLVAGAEEAEIILNNSSASRRQVVHVFKVDGSKVDILPGYYGIDKDLRDSANWTDSKVTDTAAYYENQLGYELVGGMNIALAYDCNAPYSFLVYEGKVLQNYHDPALNDHSGSCQTYLAIFKDGSCELRSRDTKLTGDEWHAVGANFGWLVKDGQLVSKKEERTSSAASRSMLGILPDGSLIMCMVDGRGANNSVGLSNYEMGEFMLALGCVNAVNGDGGGSSTFISRREGEAALTMRSSPSDGAERPTLNSVFLAKKKGIEPGTFDHVNIASGYDYFVPGTGYTFDVIAIDTTGAEMALPSGGSWSLADSAFGTIDESGTFVSNGKLGDVTVRYSVSGTVAEKTITVTNPVVAQFALTSTVLPYGKTTQLTMNVWADAVGEYPMYFQADSFNWSVSDETAGSLNMDDLSYTAAADESKKGVTITAAYKHAEMEPTAFVIEFGKGSEIITGWNFESGDVSEWMGFDAAKAWSAENGITNSLVGNNPLDGQYNENIVSHTFLADDENGKVKNGQYALGLELDYTDASFAGWSYNHLFFVGDKVVFRDVANGLNATTLGMWLYIPEGATGLAFQSQFWNGAKCVQDHFTFVTTSGVRKNLNSCTEADIPAHRWVYASIDISKYDYLSTMDPFETYGNVRSPSFIRMYIKPMKAQNLTFYIDDITLDYSSAVDDREAPVIGEIMYAIADESMALEDSAVSASSAGFSASVADYAKNNATGLNTATAQIYLDGVAVETEISGGSMFTKTKVALTNGPHMVTFEIADNLGNSAQKSALFTVEPADQTEVHKSIVYLDGHNDNGKKPECDSVYYVDIKTTDAAAVSGVEANIQLNTANAWEAAHMIVAPGYEVTYTLLDDGRVYNTFSANTDVHSVENVVAITLTRTDACTLTGEQTLVSIPVRVWSWDGINHVTGEAIKPEDQFASGYCPIVTVDYQVLKGSAQTRTGDVTFGGSISVETMINDDVNPWHTHSAYALEDKAATCTEPGYTGRTYCDGCASVVAWGTSSAATGHSDAYDYYSGVLACPDCQTVANITGLIEHNGFTYYAIAGQLQRSWQQIGDDWYFFYPNTFKGATGQLTGGSSAVPVVFELVNGKLQSGVWREINGQYRYYYGPDYYRTTWATIDGEKYYFNDGGYRLTGYNLIKLSRYSKEDDYQMYLFGEDGKLLETLTHTGLLEANGNIYYLVNGIGNHAGLIQIDGYYYYINGEYMAVTGEKTIYGPWDNGLLPVGTYTFGEDGRMIVETDETLNGIVGDYYYIDGEIQKTGLIQIDGDYYYFSTTNGVMSRNVTRMVYRIHESCDMPKGEYIFGEDGKAILTGVYGDYYYIDGEIQKTGLIKIGEDYYYFSTTNGVMSRNVTKMVYRIHESCDLPKGEYTFGPDGKVVFPNLEGIVGDYYYIDGVIQKTGLIKIGEDYYYFSTTNGVMSRNVTKMIYRIHESCDLPQGEYTFGEDGKVVFTAMNGIVGDYYYIDGEIQKTGLIKIDGDYYYFSTTNGVMSRNVTKMIYRIHESCDLPQGEYTFGEDGKVVFTNMDGIVGDYYYVDGEIQKTGLIKIGEDYYYFSTTNGIMSRSVTKMIYRIHESCDLPQGVYTFGEDGKVIF